MPPTAANKNMEAREFAAAVLTGTVIGRSLQEALQSLSEEDGDVSMDVKSTVGNQSDTHSTDNTNYSDDHVVVDDYKQSSNEVACHLRMNKNNVERIMKSFEEAVVESGICHDTDKDSAPRILLKGRCDHFNKYGQNWMVSMDQVRIKKRPTKFTKRRRDDRPSLWDRDDDRAVTASKSELIVKEEIQLLAYGDSLKTI